MEEASLDEIEKAREEGKRPYQKMLLAVIAGYRGVSGRGTDGVGGTGWPVWQ